MGPLFLTGAMKRANGEPAKDAGIGITAVTVGLMVPATAMAWFNLRARRPPLLRIGRDGIEVRVIGQTTLDGIPGIPGVARFAWGVLSTQSFRSHTLRCAWKEIQKPRVAGLPGMRVLILDGTFRPIPNASSSVAEPVGNQIIFQQVDFKRPLQEVAEAIAFYAENPAGWRRTSELVLSG